MNNRTCKASPERCGTLAGYQQAGGRCYLCRRANAAKTAGERGDGITREQRDAIILMVNNGAEFDTAVREAGTNTQKVMRAAAVDAELRSALEGRDRKAQYAARIGDYLAALCRNGGDTVTSYPDAGLTRQQVSLMRHRDPAFAQLEASLIEYLGATNQHLGTKRAVPDFLVERAVELLEGGHSVGTTCRQLGVSVGALELPPVVGTP